MKNYRIASFCLILFCYCSMLVAKDVYLFSYFTGNGEDGLHFAYSEDGLQWTPVADGKSFLTPELGKDKLMRDPSIVQGEDGLFHMVWTTGWWDKHIGHASSSDLINWSNQQIIPVMEHLPETKNSWAPEVFYDSKSKLYYIIWASTIPGMHTPVAESETEKGLNHRQYFVTTPDFETFSPTKIFFNPDFSVIDGAILKQGKEYLFFVKNENPNPPQKNIRVTRTRDLKKGFPIAVSEPITGNYWAEGASPLQVGKYIYVYFDKYMEGKYGAVRSDDGGKTWEDVSDQITFPKGTRHGTAFKLDKKIAQKLLQ